jgi:hypothetical protein
MGYDAPHEIAPGEMISVAIQWLVCREHDALTWPSLILVGEDGVERVVPPLSSAIEDRRPGALIVEQYAFIVPDNLARVEMRGGRPSFPGISSRYRMRVGVTSPPPLVASFGEQIRLRSYAYGAESYRPGDTLRLTLEWEALRTVEEPYKVFVHVLGRDGLPIAQQDNEPINGTYPTTRWQGGERVSDPYVISLPSDLPPGEYSVEVGLYRLSDLSRLPVLGQDRSVIDDKVYLAPLIVE